MNAQEEKKARATLQEISNTPRIVTIGTQSYIWTGTFYSEVEIATAAEEMLFFDRTLAGEIKKIDPFTTNFSEVA
jgi:hypothetical protein